MVKVENKGSFTNTCRGPDAKKEPLKFDPLQGGLEKKNANFLGKIEFI